jgi:hypothetical protein
MPGRIVKIWGVDEVSATFGQGGLKEEAECATHLFPFALLRLLPPFLETFVGGGSGDADVRCKTCGGELAGLARTRLGTARRRGGRKRGKGG